MTKLVTFTFDDGITNNTELLLDILDKEAIKATFFIIGNTLNLKNNKIRLKEIHSRGHTIGNHTWSHPQITKISEASLLSELKMTQDAISDLIGVPCKYFRPPYGATNKKINLKLASLGYSTTLWNVDAQDWNIKKSKVAMMAYYKSMFELNKGYIILQHDRRLASVELVPDIAKLVRSRDFKIVSLDNYVP